MPLGKKNNNLKLEQDKDQAAALSFVMKHLITCHLPLSHRLHTAFWRQRRRKVGVVAVALWKRGGGKTQRGRWGLRDCKRLWEWKPSENPYTWFIPVRLCAVGRSYLLFMRASAAKRPDVKLCGDLIRASHSLAIKLEATTLAADEVGIGRRDEALSPPTGNSVSAANGRTETFGQIQNNLSNNEPNKEKGRNTREEKPWALTGSFVHQLVSPSFSPPVFQGNSPF